MTLLRQDYERRIGLEGAVNFRDLGGYPTLDGRRVRWRRLFRSDRLVGLTGADLSALASLRIASVFDLRTADELDRHGIGLLHDGGILHRHVPFVTEVWEKTTDIDGDESAAGRQASRYLALIEQAHFAIFEVFNALAEPHHYPAVFHCTAGKDRTGMMAALILTALNVPDEVIAEDYALTTEFLTWTDEDLARLAPPGAQPMTRDDLFADPETILIVLATLEEWYGSMRAFFTDCGVTDAHLAALRIHMLED
jgi:protein-tyrosine phosphatase